MPDTDRLATALADRYVIERELGQGGMATVYLARDLRHDRLVALKVLRPELAAILGAERFLQEIKTTANLQHPHILPLHDSGEAGGNVFYVMPYVEGESLRDRLSRDKQLPVDVAVRITREVASALDYAHRHGVVHRDIKPENILLHEGQALVADFGIALAVSRSDGGTRMTETGMSLGTPHYMSPEQAMGEREITPRSDVYALGCVAYEMLIGDPPFTGSTAQAIVARVLTEQPRTLTLQRHTIPPHVEAAVLTALEKLPADRYATAAEFAEALANPALTAARTQASAPAMKLESRWRRIAMGTAAVALGAIGVALWGWLRPTAPRPVVRYSLGLPGAQSMQQGVFGVNLAMSPDGRRIVYVGPGPQGGQLWLRERDRLDATPLPGTDAGVNPSFSPDGRQVAFSVGGQYELKVVSIDGGPPVTLAQPGSGGGVAWGSDGWIYFDRPNGLGRVRAGGGAAEDVVPLDTAHGEIGHAWPEALPNGKAIIFRSRRSLNPEDFDIVVFDLRTHQRHVLTKGLLARYVAPGFLVFVRADGALVASRFSTRTLTLSGSPTPLLEGIMSKPFGSVDLAVSREGTLAYVPGAASASAGEAVWVTRDGVITALTPALGISPSGPRRGLALSPDGTRLAIDVVGPRSVDIWVKQLPTGPFSRLTFEGSDNFRPSWTADSKSVVFLSTRDGNVPSVWRQRADGSAPAEQLLRMPTATLYEAQLSPDGHWLIYRANADDGGPNIYGRRLGQDTTPVPLAVSRFVEVGPSLSPDGAYMAYASDESGQFEVYVRPFPRTSEGRWQISSGGGFAPRWSHSGRELYYESSSAELMAAVVTTRPTFSAAAARRVIGLATSQLWVSNTVPYWDLTPDDRRFLMVKVGATTQAPGAGQLVMVENWTQELRSKVETGQR